MMVQLGLLRRHLSAFTRVVTLSERDPRCLADEGFDAVRGPPQPRARSGRCVPRSSGPPTVAYAGRLVFEKGVDVLRPCDSRGAVGDSGRAAPHRR